MTNWDEHLSKIIFSYMTIYKVATLYTPYKLVYGWHPLMPTKYVLLVINGDHKYVKPIKILTTIITKLEKL
jgi:hypothetical protein